MNINLHNYEEYFLLYADKELSLEEKREVEAFVQLHPELEEEFEMINSAILEPEMFHLQDKSFLLKSTETDFINKTNYEESFVLYHDGELSEEQKAQADNFLKENPELRDEFLLISQAKIQPEPISFPDKKSLLRKEQTGITGRIILFRSLAAAVVLGFGLWITFPYFSGGDSQIPVAQQVTTPENYGHETTTPTPPENVENSVAANDNLVTNEQSDKSTEKQTEKAEPKSPVITKQSEKGVNLKQQTVLAKNEQNLDNNSLQQDKNVQLAKKNKNNEGTNEVMTAQIPPMDISPGEMTNKSELVHVDIDITPTPIEKNYSPRNVVYLDVNKQPSGNYILNVPEEEFRKTKVGGFLKQLKRVVDRNDPIKRLFAGEEGQVASNN